jgi:hypothetical protein
VKEEAKEGREINFKTLVVEPRQARFTTGQGRRKFTLLNNFAFGEIAHKEHLTG